MDHQGRPRESLRCSKSEQGRGSHREVAATELSITARLYLPHLDPPNPTTLAVSGRGSSPVDLLAGGAGAVRAELGHSRGTDSRQQDPHGPAGQRQELRGGADEHGDVLHRGDGPQVDHKEDPLQILIQSHLSWDNGTFAEWFLRARPGGRGRGRLSHPL